MSSALKTDSLVQTILLTENSRSPPERVGVCHLMTESSLSIASKIQLVDFRAVFQRLYRCTSGAIIRFSMINFFFKFTVLVWNLVTEVYQFLYSIGK